MTSLDLILQIAFWLALASAAGGAVCVYRFKRTQISWVRFFIAGPRIFLQPGRYLESGGSRAPKLMFTLFVCVFVAASATLWVHSNL